MQRGETGIGFIVFVVIGIVVAFSFIVLTLNKPTGHIVNIEDFYRENTPYCSTVFCSSEKSAYYLGNIGNYAKCCCPENYITGSGSKYVCRLEIRVPIF